MASYILVPRHKPPAPSLAPIPPYEIQRRRSLLCSIQFLRHLHRWIFRVAHPVAKGSHICIMNAWASLCDLSFLRNLLNLICFLETETACVRACMHGCSIQARILTLFTFVADRGAFSFRCRAVILGGKASILSTCINSRRHLHPGISSVSDSAAGRSSSTLLSIASCRAGCHPIQHIDQQQWRQGCRCSDSRRPPTSRGC